MKSLLIKFNKIHQFSPSILIFSLLFGVAYTLGRKINFFDNIALSYKENTFSDFTPWDLLVFILVSCLVYLAYQLVQTGIQMALHKNVFLIPDQTKISYKRQALLLSFFAALLFMAWSPYLLSLAPGSVLGDSFISINQALGNAPLTNHHPVMYTLTIKIFMKLGIFLGDLNKGIFLYSLFQSALMSLVLGYFLLWLYRKGVRRFWLFLTYGYFAFVPFFPTYAIIMWKDPIFSLALFFMMLLVFDLIESKGELFSSALFYIFFYLSSFLISFYRNNGFPVLVLIYLFLILLYRKRRTIWKFALGCLLFCGSVMIIQGPVYDYFEIEKPFVESFAIPLQQMAYVVVNQGEITPDQEKVLYQLLPEKDYITYYTPCLVDSIKWSGNFDTQYLNDNKGLILKTWASMLVPNFSSYVKAYCLETFGFWKIGIQNSYGYIDTYILDNQMGITNIDLFQKIFGFSIADSLKNFRPSIGTGTMVWLMLFSASFILPNKKTRPLLIAFLPAFLTWLIILVATPAAFSLRYVYVIPLAVPLFFFFPFLTGKMEKQS